MSNEWEIREVEGGFYVISWSEDGDEDGDLTFTLGEVPFSLQRPVRSRYTESVEGEAAFELDLATWIASSSLGVLKYKEGLTWESRKQALQVLRAVRAGIQAAKLEAASRRQSRARKVL